MSEVKVNKISPRSGTEVTLGDSGDTFTIPSGATINNQGTATNFGATGSASWVTTVKTSTFTAVAGEGYFVNTTGGAVTVNLPAGTAGAVVAIKDYANTFDTNAVTLVQNGSDKIGGSTVNATLDVEGIAVTLVFIDSTQGWLVTDSGLQSESPTAAFVTATGGTITTSGNFKIHTFTSPGTFCVSCAGNATGSNSVDYLVVAGGGGGGYGGYGSGTGGFRGSGGGGAGGFRVFANTTNNPGFTSSPANPLNGPAAISVTATGFPITVGGGGAGGTTGQGVDGSNSIFSSIASAGGGGGGACNAPTGLGRTGGSGGGSGANSCGGATGAAGNTPPVSPSQGNSGGNGIPSAPNGGSAGGGGGALAAGAVGAPPNSGTNGGPGGVGGGVQGFGTSGVNCGSNYFFAGGGGGGNYGCGGNGGGGKAGRGSPAGNPQDGTAGTVNTGGGGGGTGGFSSDGCQTGGAGGSGIVVIRYKFQ